MKGYVVQVTSVSGNAATLRYYVLCEDEAEAIRLVRTTFASESDWAISVLRSVASWEIDAFRLKPGEVKQAP